MVTAVVEVPRWFMPQSGHGVEQDRRASVPVTSAPNNQGSKDRRKHADHQTSLVNHGRRFGGKGSHKLTPLSAGIAGAGSRRPGRATPCAPARGSPTFSPAFQLVKSSFYSPATQQRSGDVPAQSAYPASEGKQPSRAV